MFGMEGELKPARDFSPVSSESKIYDVDSSRFPRRF